MLLVWWFSIFKKNSLSLNHKQNVETTIKLTNCHLGFWGEGQYMLQQFPDIFPVCNISLPVIFRKDLYISMLVSHPSCQEVVVRELVSSCRPLKMLLKFRPMNVWSSQIKTFLLCKRGSLESTTEQQSLQDNSLTFCVAACVCVCL